MNSRTALPSVIIPFLVLRDVLGRLRQGGSRQIQLSFAANRIGNRIEYSNAPLSAASHRFLLRLVDTTDEWNRIAQLTPKTSLLLIGTGPAAGLAAGWVTQSSRPGVLPLPAILEFPGPGMEVLPPWISPPPNHPKPTGNERWSRTENVLGLGLGRIQELPFAVIGAGRLGSSFVTELARSGVQSITVIDPDRVELSNLGESDFTEADLGRNKADALRERFQGLPRSPEIRSVPHSVTHREGVDAVRQARIILSCADHGSARLVAGILATAYHRVLVDVGTMIQQEGRTWTRGLDVRVLLPGDRCLQCFGSVRNRLEAFDAIRSPDVESALQRQRDWRTERSGSLRSLNLMAIGLALRFTEDLVGGRLDRSTWRRIGFDRHGTPHLNSIEPARMAGAPCWCGLAGTGEHAFSRLTTT